VGGKNSLNRKKVTPTEPVHGGDSKEGPGGAKGKMSVNRKKSWS